MKLINSPSILLAVLTVLTLFSTLVMAQEEAWMNSYKLEAVGKYADAITAIDQVPANGPEAEFKALRRGWLYYMAGSFNESIREYRYATERNKGSVDARLGVTLPLLAQKRWREAEQNARESLQLAPNNYTGMLRLTLALEGEHDWENMLKTTVAMVGLYPSDATAYVYLARAYAWLGQRSEAIAAYTAVLARYPGHLEAKSYLAQK